MMTKVCKVVFVLFFSNIDVALEFSNSCRKVPYLPTTLNTAIYFISEGTSMAQVAKKVVVDLFYDVVSPYSYIAFEALTRYNHEWKNMKLQLKPVYLAGIMAGSSNVPPGSNRAKARYMNRDLPRMAKYFALPFKYPANMRKVMFEKGTKQAQRFLAAASRECPQHLEQLSRELFLRMWVKDEDVTTDESLKEAGKRAGIPENELSTLVSIVANDEVKQSLKDTTQTALDYGAFGAPTYVVHLQDGPVMLFGLDRLFLLAHYLGNQWQPTSPGVQVEAKI